MRSPAVAGFVHAVGAPVEVGQMVLEPCQVIIELVFAGGAEDVAGLRFAPAVRADGFGGCNQNVRLLKVWLGGRRNPWVATVLVSIWVYYTRLVRLAWVAGWGFPSCLVAGRAGG